MRTLDPKIYQDAMSGLEEWKAMLTEHLTAVDDAIKVLTSQSPLAQRMTVTVNDLSQEFTPDLVETTAKQKLPHSRRGRPRGALMNIRNGKPTLRGRILKAMKGGHPMNVLGISMALGVSKIKVGRALTKLADRGHIERLRRRQGRGGMVTYVLKEGR